MKKITITKPDDWHIHLRQDSALKTTVDHTASQFKRAIVMPNTLPPITNVQQAEDYYHTILKYTDNNFQPIMTLYLTDKTSVQNIEDINKINSNKDNFKILACKLYPQGATTNSDSGVSNIENIYPVLEAMQKNNIALLIHGEVTEDHIDIFDREAVFIESTLSKIREEFPELKITLEHITTKIAVDFILNNNKNTAATITPHHLLLNRNDLLVGGIKPHYYCLPILKNRANQEAVVQAALSGDCRFFAGSDSAPHAIDKKQSACGCAGIYHGPNTLLIYADFFDNHNQLDKLEPFVSFYGADFYGLERNPEKITLVNKAFSIPEKYDYMDTSIVPLLSNSTVNWSFETNSNP